MKSVYSLVVVSNVLTESKQEMFWHKFQILHSMIYSGVLSYSHSLLLFFFLMKPFDPSGPKLPELIPGFCSMKRLGVFLLPLDRMLVHCRSFSRNLLGFPNNLPVPIYTPGWREALWGLSVLPKNTTQSPQPGLKPGPLTPGTSTLTMRPPCLPPLYYGHLITTWTKAQSVISLFSYGHPITTRFLCPVCDQLNREFHCIWKIGPGGPGG